MAGHQDESKVFGRRLFPVVFDQIAKSTPKRIYASLPIKDDLSQGFYDVTFGEFKNAVDSVARSIVETPELGYSSDFATICYVGEPDLRTAVLFLAAVKCGYKLLLVSPRNAAATNVSLLEQTRCKALYHSAIMAPLAQQLKTGTKSNHSLYLLPSFNDLIASTPDHVEFFKTFADAVNNPILVLHSSGSTGLPKPITITHGAFATLDAAHNLRDIPGRKRHDFTIFNLNPSGKFYNMFPPFHMAGFCATVLDPIFSNAAIPVLGPALRPPTGAMTLEILQKEKIVAMLVVPSIIEQMMKEPDALELLREMKFVCYAGGPLSTPVGQQLCDHVDLCQFYGSTETLTPPQLVPTKEDWDYMEWHPDFQGIMEPSDVDIDVYEMIYPYDNLNPDFAGIAHTMPGMKEYRTKDLFKRHPTKPNLWRFHGRKDDIIVLANGEKFNPVPMEIELQGSPAISGAIVVGYGRSEAALLLETVKPASVEDIWPAVEKANNLLPGQGRIIKTRIVIGSSQKPFVRAGKGTVIRKLTAELYSEELAALYARQVFVQPKKTFLRPRYDLEDIKDLLRSIAGSVLSQTSIDGEDDFFSIGMDSVKSIEIIDKLRSELEPHSRDQDLSWLDIRVLYQNSSVTALSKIVSDFLNHQTVPDTTNTTSVKVEEIIAQLTKGLSLRPATSRPQRQKLAVALVGSRGSLGTALVQSLKKQSSIESIICFDRPLKQNSSSSSPATDAKIKHHIIDYSQEDLSLSSEAVTELTSEVDILLFNAWPVDFNLPLQAFMPNLKAIRSFINILSTDNQGTKQSPHVVYISSIAASTPSTPSKLNLPQTGYGQSKLVAEGIIAAASRDSHIPSTILRVGQIAPATSSSSNEPAFWPTSEWFPLICKTSSTLNAFPTGLQGIDWIPVDTVAEIVKEISIHSTATEQTQDLGTYTLVNPSSVPWTAIVDAIAVKSERRTEAIKFVPFQDWVALLESRQNDTTKDDLPALKLLPFFRTMSQLAAKDVKTAGATDGDQQNGNAAFGLPSKNVSPIFDALRPASEADLRRWVAQFFE